MSEVPLSSTEECPKRKKPALCSLILSVLHHFFAFVLSHPLYFSYLLFFSPYIVKILSFLSPLFLTTALILLALLSTLHVHDTCSDPEFLGSQPSLLFSSYSKLGSVLRSKFDVKDEDPVSLEAYKMVFETCTPEIASETEPEEVCSTSELTFVDKFCSHESTRDVGTVSESLWEETNEEEDEIPLSKTDDLMNLEEEIFGCEKEEEEVKPLSGAVPNKDEGDNWEMPTKMESKAQKVGVDGNCNDEERELPKLSHFLGKISVDDDEGEKENADSHNAKGEIITTLSSFGSMRKEREWRRTLACKLFEERHNVAGDGGGGGGDDGGERMDLLWEAYETHIDKTPLRSDEKKQTKKNEKQKPKKTKSKNIEEIYKHEAHDDNDDVHDDDDDDDDGDDDGDEQLCCLQALKFSTGKMNLGIARPSLLKLSKAFKGFGRFHGVSKHSKKT